MCHLKIQEGQFQGTANIIYTHIYIYICLNSSHYVKYFTERKDVSYVTETKEA
jgi:hypothetical protein